nr:hypothetical protein [uncultured Dethiosulfovibrio sp.]
MESLLWIIVPLFVHEGAHYLAAFLLGYRISFTFSWGRLGPVKVPRWTWRWPEAPRRHIKIICQAGFVAEIGLAFFMPWPYQAVAIIHFAAYPWYAGESTDFKGMI